MWKPNDRLLDEIGREAKLITMPIPGRVPAVGVIQYADGRGRQVELEKCQPTEEEPCHPTKSS